jgi:hypothetical protein
MSNNKVEDKKVKEAVLENTDNGVVETAQELDPKQVIQDLMIQEKHHGEREEYHRTMRIKARGALEIVTQMHPQEETKQ